MAQYIIDNVPAPINMNPGTATERLLQRCKNLLMTQMGEVPFDRHRGIDPAYYDMTIVQMRSEMIEEMDRVFLWCEEIEVISCECGLLPGGEVHLRVTIETDIDD